MTPDVEDLLRARLHEVDDLQPPTTASSCARCEPDATACKRRQAWTRGLVGAAAAVAVGALAVPAVGRLGANGGTASSGSAASKVSAPQAPQGAEGAAPSGPADASTGAATYTAAQCQSTLARVAADRDTLTRQGYAVGSLTCDSRRPGGASRHQPRDGGAAAGAQGPLRRPGQGRAGAGSPPPLRLS